MVRILTTTKSGKLFKSPMIYPEGTAKMLMDNLSGWHTRGGYPAYETVTIDLKSCHEDCYYNQSFETDDIAAAVGLAERRWE